MNENVELLNQYQSYLIACDRSSETVKTYLRVLKQFIKKYPVQLRFPKQEFLISFFSQSNLSKVTLHSRFNVFVIFYRWMSEEHKVLINPMLKLNAPKLVKGLPKLVMTKGETQLLLNAVSDDRSNPFHYRDRLIMELMYSCSLRRGEVVSLNVDDYDQSTQSLRLRAEECKSRTGRIVPIGSYANELLKTYLNHVRPAGGEAIFKNYKGDRLGSGYVTRMVTKLRKQLKIKTKATSHSLRKSSATHMLRNKAPLVSVSKLLGHKDISATQLYTKVYPVDLVKMHRAHHPREKQKNIRMPKLEVFQRSKMSNLYEVLESHPRENDDVPLLETYLNIEIQSVSKLGNESFLL